LLRKGLKKVEDDWIHIVIEEIESWYLAVVTDEGADRLGIRIPASTDSVDKEAFDALVPAAFASRIDFMIEVLRDASWEAGARRNASLRRFLKRQDIACTPPG